MACASSALIILPAFISALTGAQVAAAGVAVIVPDMTAISAFETVQVAAAGVAVISVAPPPICA